MADFDAIYQDQPGESTVEYIMEGGEDWYRLKFAWPSNTQNFQGGKILHVWYCSGMARETNRLSLY